MTSATCVEWNQSSVTSATCVEWNHSLVNTGFTSVCVCVNHLARLSGPLMWLMSNCPTMICLREQHGEALRKASANGVRSQKCSNRGEVELLHCVFDDIAQSLIGKAHSIFPLGTPQESIRKLLHCVFDDIAQSRIGI